MRACIFKRKLVKESDHSLTKMKKMNDSEFSPEEIDINDDDFNQEAEEDLSRHSNFPKKTSKLVK